MVRDGVRSGAVNKEMRSSAGIQKEKEKMQQERDEKLRLLFLKFRRSETELDWNYPFDFCGSIYRLVSVEEVLTKIEPISQILKPNTFEFAGNKAIKFNMLAKNMPYSICLNWPVVTVITINKVHDVDKTPIYNLIGFSDPNEETKDSTTPEEDCLLQMNRFFS
jgi:hypothetical protein